MKKHFKRVGTDLAGYGLILAGLSLGWLPGPGGIPLILSGLGLLSIHNAWARRLVEQLQKHGGKLVEFAFPDNRTIQFAHDCLVILFIAAATYLGLVGTEWWQYGLSLALVAVGIADFAFNRRRFERYTAKR